MAAKAKSYMDMTAIVVHCDGLCEPTNPGGTATYGWVARRGGDLVGSGHGVVAKGPQATNNLAEYTAIIEALTWLERSGLSGEQISLRSDSQLAIRQLTGQYEVRSPKIWPLYTKASQLARRFPNLRFKWVPREQNSEADHLSRVAYAEADSEGEEKRRERAAGMTGSVEQVDERTWRVRSSHGPGSYTVRDAATCNCPDFARRHAPCKHVFAVRQVITATSSAN